MVKQYKQQRGFYSAWSQHNKGSYVDVIQMNVGEEGGGSTGGKQAKPKLNKRDFHPHLRRLCESIDSMHACLREDDSRAAQ